MRTAGGAPYQHLATMVVGGVRVRDSAVSITDAVGAQTLAATENPGLCGRCAMTRWLRIVTVEPSSAAWESVAGRSVSMREQPLGGRGVGDEHGEPAPD